MTTYRSAEEGRVRMPHTNTSLGSSGPTRVETGEHDPGFRPRPVGFTADLDDPEPLLWEGDGG